MRNPYLSLLATAWRYARLEKKRFLLIYFLFVMANVVIACNPIFYGWFINELQIKGVDALRAGWIYITLFLGCKLLEWTFHGPSRIMERKLAFSLSRNFMEEYYDKTLHLPMSWHQDHHSGSTLNRLRKAYEALRDFFQNGFVYFYSFGKFFFSFGAMLYFSPFFGSIGVVLGVATVLIIRKFDKPYIASLKEVNEREHELSSNLFDSLSNIVTVITLRLEKRVQKTFLTKLLAIYSPFKRNVTINEWKWFVAQMMIGIIYAVTVLGYVYQHWQPGETFLIGGLIVLLGYVNQFTSVFTDIASHYTQIIKYDTDVKNVQDIDTAYQANHQVDTHTPLPTYWQTLDIRDISFHRSKAFSLPRVIGINNIDIRIEKGQRIAIIGESGSGKSTLLAVLRGLYKPHGESVVIINDNERVGFESISTAVTLLPQDPEIFENTVRYNITLGLSFSDADIIAACEAAQFIRVIEHLPNGLDTNIMEKGVNLSGGQKQRLALARGILAARNSDIILLDEPTSSVDPRTEQAIYQNIFKSFPEKTVISALHRLHLLHLFDYIYMLKDGFIIDKGTPNDLERYSLAFKKFREHRTEIEKLEQLVNESLPDGTY